MTTSRRTFSTQRIGVILLVEDDPSDADRTIRALQRARILNPVRVVRDAETALQLLRRQEYAGKIDDQPINLVLLELTLPGMSGREPLDMVCADRLLRRVPIIVLAGTGSMEDRVKSYRSGALGFLEKPIDVSHLLRVLGDRKDGGLPSVPMTVRHFPSAEIV